MVRPRHSIYISRTSPKPLNKTMNYSTFCIAAYILRKDPERFDRLDGVWTVAKQYYNSYLNSKYNDISKSELDCVNDFMDARYPKN
jgi:hypothetical protein